MRRFSAIKVVGIAAFCLMGFILGLSLVNGATGSKTPQWSARIDPSSPNLKAVFPNGYPTREFVNGENGVTIQSGGSSCGNRQSKIYTSYISLQIALPGQIEFVNLTPQESAIWDASRLCQFPFLSGSTKWPDCLTYFLSQPQPYDGYQLIALSFNTPGCEEKTSYDFTEMTIGETMRMNFSMDLRWDSIDCLRCEENNISMVAHGTDWSVPDVSIHRDNDNEWTVAVDTDFTNPLYYPCIDWRSCDGIKAFYCTCVEKHNHKGVAYYEKQYVGAAWTKAKVAFKITFTRS
jgi:hypothetical protein